MRRSKVDTAATRQHILETASQLFLNQGIAATSIADVMSAAGLTTGGFYRHFTSKEQLVAEANSVTVTCMIETLALETADKPPKEAIKALARHYFQHIEEGAVAVYPLTNLGSELLHADENVRGAVIAGYENIVRLVASHTARLGCAHHESLAIALISTLVGAGMLAKLALDEAKARAIVASAQMAIDTLLDTAATTSGR